MARIADYQRFANVKFPGNHRFAFTVLDDTDNATLDNVTAVYDLLADLGIRTTKSVWAYPPRDEFSGQSLEDPSYQAFLESLQDSGFELCLHSVGSGAFSRQEILEGFERFKEVFGTYPRVHANHSLNPDNLYWNARDRFVFPLDRLVELGRRLRARPVAASSGHIPSSPHFWGDMAKRQIEYVRDLTFTTTDTLEVDPLQPYRIQERSEYSNYWFSASDGHTVEEFNRLTSPRQIDRLGRRGGVCIVYTHFASGFADAGKLNEQFERQMRYLAHKDGWFAPVSSVLDHLRRYGPGANVDEIDRSYRLRLNLRWARDRVLKVLRSRR